MCCIDACLYLFSSVPYTNPVLQLFTFGCLEDKPEIDDDIFFRLFSGLRWLRVVEGGSCITCRASHFIELPCQTSFHFFFLVVCFRWLSTLLPPMCVILVVYCKSCVCYFATSCVPSLMPSPCTVAALSYDFVDEVILTDEASTVRFVAAQLSPLKEYRVSIVRTPGDVTSRQES